MKVQDVPDAIQQQPTALQRHTAGYKLEMPSQTEPLLCEVRRRQGSGAGLRRAELCGALLSELPETRAVSQM